MTNRKVIMLDTETLTPLRNMDELMQYYPPIDLYNERLRELTKKLGPAWLRVSGTWATKTYYDFEGTTNGKAPDGYASVLTKEQWIGVLDFVKAVGGKLVKCTENSLVVMARVSHGCRAVFVSRYRFSQNLLFTTLVKKYQSMIICCLHPHSV